MNVKMILSVTPEFRRTALMLCQERGQTISELIIELIEREAAKEKDQFDGLANIWGDNPTTAAQLRKRATRRS